MKVKNIALLVSAFCSTAFALSQALWIQPPQDLQLPRDAAVAQEPEFVLLPLLPLFRPFRGAPPVAPVYLPDVGYHLLPLLR